VSRQAFLHCAKQMGISPTLMAQLLGVSVSVVNPQIGLAQRMYRAGGKKSARAEYAEFKDTCDQILRILRGEKDTGETPNTIRLLQARVEKLERDISLQKRNIHTLKASNEDLQDQLKHEKAKSQRARHQLSEKIGELRAVEADLKAAELHVNRAEAALDKALKTSQVVKTTETRAAEATKPKKVSKQPKKSAAPKPKPVASTAKKPQAKKETSKRVIPTPPPKRLAAPEETLKMISDGTSITMTQLVQATCAVTRIPERSLKSGNVPKDIARKAAIRSVFCYLAQKHTEASDGFIATHIGIEPRKVAFYVHGLNQTIGHDFELQELLDHVRVELYALRHAA